MTTLVTLPTPGRPQAVSAAIGTRLRSRDAHPQTCEVVRRTELEGHVINPVTTAATILVADVDATSQPLLASTHPAWIAPFMLAAPTFPFVATRMVSYSAPEATQDAYTAAEAAIAGSLPAIHTTRLTLPATFFVGVLVADAAFAVGVLIHALALPLGIAGMTCFVRARK